MSAWALKQFHTPLGLGSIVELNSTASEPGNSGKSTSVVPFIPRGRWTYEWPTSTAMASSQGSNAIASSAQANSTSSGRGLGASMARLYASSASKLRGQNRVCPETRLFPPARSSGIFSTIRMSASGSRSWAQMAATAPERPNPNTTTSESSLHIVTLSTLAMFFSNNGLRHQAYSLRLGSGETTCAVQRSEPLGLRLAARSPLALAPSP